MSAKTAQGDDVDIFISVGDKGICGKHGCELEVDIVEMLDLGTGEKTSETVLCCPICLTEDHGYPEIFSDSRAICPKHHCRYSLEVPIEDYDQVEDMPVAGVGYSCPICVEEWEAAHPKPQPSNTDTDVPF